MSDGHGGPAGAPVLTDEQAAWALLLALKRRARAGGLGAGPLSVSPDGQVLGDGGDRRACLAIDANAGWRGQVGADVRVLLDLFLPLALAGAGRPLVIGQLGQSLDGRIATENGASHYITGPAGLRHLHRLRALADAVVVGASTVRHDDPRLTTRHVPGDNPVRVVIDAHGRLDPRRNVFCDGAAPTLVVTARPAPGAPPGRAALVELPAADGALDPAAILAALRARGLHTILVEGGGQTVSRFLQCGCLDRLHLMVAPMIIGSGRPGLTLPAIADLDEALRPRCRRYPMGDDILFDCALA